MKRRVLLLSMVAVLVVGIVTSGCAKPATTPATAPATTPATTPAKVYEWKLQSFCTPGEPKYFEDLAYFTKLVYESTQGRIKITTFPVGAIAQGADIYDACAQGIVPMIHTVGGYSVGKIPVTGVEVTTPGLYLSADDLFDLMWLRGLQDVFTEAHAAHGVHYLGFQPARGVPLSTVKPVRTLADLKGRKIKAYGTWATYMSKFGASPVNLPMAETYMALKLGTLEGTLTGWDAVWGMKLHEVAKYMTVPWMSEWETLQVSVNLGVWKALPDDLKGILTMVTRNWAHRVAVIESKERGKVIFGDFAAAGVEWVNLSPADVATLRTAAWEMWDEWAKKDAYCAKALGIIKDYQREQGYIK